MDEAADQGGYVKHVIQMGYGYDKDRPGVTQCRLRIYEEPGLPTVAVLTELPDNQGRSITNAIEDIANQVRRMLTLAHEDLIIIEHQFPRSISIYRDGHHDLPEEFSRVTFNIRGGRFCHPSWTHMPRAMVEELIDQPFD